MYAVRISKGSFQVVSHDWSLLRPRKLLTTEISPWLPVPDGIKASGKLPRNVDLVKGTEYEELFR